MDSSLTGWAEDDKIKVSNGNSRNLQALLRQAAFHIQMVFLPTVCYNPARKRKKDEKDMTTTSIEKPVKKSSALRRLLALAALFVLIATAIVVIRSFPEEESQFVDSIAGQIQICEHLCIVETVYSAQATFIQR